MSKIKCFFGFHKFNITWEKLYKSPIAAVFFEKECCHCGHKVEGVII